MDNLFEAKIGILSFPLSKNLRLDSLIMLCEISHLVSMLSFPFAWV